jgi:signal transduction histidine kinase
MRWRIRYQVLVPLLILLSGVAGISTWTALASAARARQQIEDNVRRVGQTLNEASFPLNRTTLGYMKRLAGADFVLLEGDGARADTFDVGEMVELPQAQVVVDDWATLRLDGRVAVAGRNYLVSGVRLRQSRPNGASTLYILYPEAQWRDARWEAVRPSLILGGFAGVASILLAVGLGQRLSRRIRQVERRTRTIAAGDFSPMPLPTGNDEVRDLATSINEMAQRLAQLQDAVQKAERLRLLGQVSGGLAHQLRNGATGARLAIQLHARECAEDPESLDVALRQLALLEANVKRFLDLGREGASSRQFCSLVSIIDEAVLLLRPQCRHARINLNWLVPDGDFRLNGDAGQLGHLFLNVIGNAIEAAGPGGEVTVELKADTSSKQLAVIEVRDSGPGPAPAVAARLFEPFVTTKPDGVGLGLAVARQAVEAHDGRLTWKREEGQTCFVIELPGCRIEMSMAQGSSAQPAQRS